MIKRILLTLILAGAVGGAVAGCNSPTTTTSPASAPAASAPAASAPAESAPAASESAPASSEAPSPSAS
jgi:hypothetical protein